VEQSQAGLEPVATFNDFFRILLAELRSGTTSYYEQDGLDAVSSMSYTTAALANTYTYDSFGKLTASTGTLINPFQYTGREFVSETELLNYWHRYYDPTIGRFLSEDPLRWEQGATFYSYVGNNPVLRTDPLGLGPNVGMMINPIDMALTNFPLESKTATEIVA